MAKIDIDLFRERQEQRLITGRTHPAEDLIIWNYTPQCVHQQAWDDVTIQSRGLITKPDGTIVSRAFPKFWNLDENKVDIPIEPFKVTTKEDGSLGITYAIGDTTYIATRGSFISEQAIKGTKILHQKYKDFRFEKQYTYLFEIVYPQNRVVVDYGDMEDLVLLAVIHTETGEEFNIHNPYLPANTWPFPVVKHYDGIKDIYKLKELEEKNKEGFVVHFQSGLRVKVKFEDYVRIHRIVFGTSARTVWEYLKEGKPLAELLEQVPDDFTAWVKNISRDLSQSFRSIHANVTATYKEIIASATIDMPSFLPKNTLTSAEVDAIGAAMQKQIKSLFSAYPDIEPFLLEMYAHRRNKQHGRKIIEQMIWDSLYPEASKPFRDEEEAQG